MRRQGIPTFVKLSIDIQDRLKQTSSAKESLMQRHILYALVLICCMEIVTISCIQFEILLVSQFYTRYYFRLNCKAVLRAC